MTRALLLSFTASEQIQFCHSHVARDGQCFKDVPCPWVKALDDARCKVDSNLLERMTSRLRGLVTSTEILITQQSDLSVARHH
jgi:hypothetical protein